MEVEERQLLLGKDPRYKARVYCDGAFDLFNYGHARVLEQAKKIFPFTCLVVGVCSDEDITASKGKPVMNVVERAEAVRQCKWADEVIVNSPWVLTMVY